jgi:hypothetical protein
MLRRSMDNKIKVLICGAQPPPHMVRFIRRTRDMHFPAIWSKELSYSLPGMMA